MTHDPVRLPINIVVYADQESRVEFTHPESSAIVTEYRRVFGPRARFSFVNACDVRSGRAFDNSPHVFILPGIFGETSYYPDHIGADGNRHIRDFVASGGIFVGYCAGAYYASQSTVYDPSWGVRKTRSNYENLSIVNAHAFGPVGTYCQPVREQREQFPEGWYRVDAVPIVLTENNKQIKMAYGYGPAFRLAAGNDINVIGRYAGVKDQPPAIIESRYGHGRVFLYGALPQYQHPQEPRVSETIPASLKDLLHSLYQHRADLAAFSARQMYRMAAHHGLSL